ASADSRSSIVGAQDPDRTPAVARASGSEGGVRGSSSAEDLARLFAEGAVRSDTYGGQSRRRLASLMLATGDRPGARTGSCAAANAPTEDPRSLAAEILDSGFDPSEIATCLPDRYEIRMALAPLSAEHGLSEDAEREWRRAAELDPAGGAAACVKLSN